MQALSRVSTKGTSYTQAQVLAVLLGPASSRQWTFDWLYPDGRYQGDLTRFVDNNTIPRITHDSTSMVQRTLYFDIRSTLSVFQVNPLRDLVRAHFQLLMPDGGFVDWVLGTFMLQPPLKRIGKQRTHQVFTACDMGQILIDGAFTGTFTLKAGQTITQCVASIFSGLVTAFPFQWIIPDLGTKLLGDLVFEAGKSRLQALWDVCAAFNYQPPSFDEFGVLRTIPVPDYAAVQPAYTFDMIGTSIGRTPMMEQKDVSKSFNQCLVIVERSSPPASFTAFYQNVNPLSEVSIPSWGHAKMGPVIRDSSIVDIPTAYSRAQTEVRAAARVYDSLPVLTSTWPASQNLDVYGLIYNAADEGVQSNLFLETRWTMECRHDGLTTHELQKIISA